MEEHLIHKYKVTGNRSFLERYYQRSTYKKKREKQEKSQKLINKFRIIADIVNKSPGKNILDVGCSTKFFKKFINHKMKYVGFDISQEFEPDIIGKAEDMGMIEDNSFDWVLLSDILEHSPKHNNIIKETFRIGRKFIAVVPNLYQLNSLTFLPRSNKDRHLVFLKPSQWINMFEKAGFKIKHIRGFYYMPSIAFIPFFPLLAFDFLFILPIFAKLSWLLDTKFADKKLLRYLAQELIIVGEK